MKFIGDSLLFLYNFRMFFTAVFFIILSITLVITSPLALIYILLSRLGIGRFMKGLIRMCAMIWAKLVVVVTGSKITVRGLENIPEGDGLCFISNHQSAMDIIVVMASLPKLAGFIAKKQLAFYPFLNLWIVAIGSIFIDRGKISKAVKSIEKGVEFIKKGNSLVIFPEGTRSKSDTMGTFKNGSMKLATRADAVVVPLTIKGSWHVWEEHKKIKPAEILFTIHPPIETGKLSPEQKKQLTEQIALTVKSGFEA